MPLYSYECQRCGCVYDEFRKYEDRDRTEMHCAGFESRRIFTPPMIISEEKVYPRYESPGTGRMVEGRRQHLEDLARSGCRIKEPGETAAYMKKVASGQLQKERREALNKAVETAVNETAQGLGLSVG